MSSVRPVLLIAVAVLMCGCGESAGPPVGQVRTTSQALENGLAALAKKDWQVANDELTAALNGVGMQPDQIEQAQLGRARARIELKDDFGAFDDLAELERGAAQMDQVWLLKCELALLQGDQKKAQDAFAEAKKINPGVEKPPGL